MTLLTRQTIIFKSRSMASELSASKHQQRRRQNSLPETTRVDGSCRNAKNEFISRLSAATTSDEESICSRGRHGLMSCFVTSNFFHETKRREEKKTSLLRKQLSWVNTRMTQVLSEDVTQLWLLNHSHGCRTFAVLLGLL